MQDIVERIKHLPSTSLGVAAGASWAALLTTLPAECAKSIGAVETWLPAVLLAAWGALLRGPAKVGADGIAKLALVATLLGLAGCATVQEDVDSVHEKLQAVTLADIEAAFASASRPAVGGGMVDPDGARCFGELRSIVAQDAARLPEIKGALSAVEAARVVRLSIESSRDAVVGRINTACAAWYMSVKGQAIKLAIQVMGLVK
jgi:hypothetical protein